MNTEILQERNVWGGRERFPAQRLGRIALAVAVLAAAAWLGRSPSRAPMALAALAGLGAFIVGQDVRRLLLVFPAVALLVPIQIGTGTDVSLNAAVVGAVGLVVMGAVHKLVRNDLYLAPSRLHRPLLIFSMISILSLVVGDATWDPKVPQPSNILFVQAGQLAIYFLSFLIFGLTANTITDLKWLRRLAYALILTGGVGTGLLVVSRLTGLTIPASSVLLNMFTPWLVSLALALALCDPTLSAAQRWGMVSACFLTLGAVVQSFFVEGNWIGGLVPPLLAGSGVMWFRFPQLRVIIVCVALFALLAIGLDPLLQAIGFDYEEKWDTSGGSRVTLWRAVIELTAERPVLGLGIAAYRHYHRIKPLAYGNALWTNPNVSAHNMFVDLFAQTGLVGVACYVWFLAEAMLLAFRLYRRHAGFARIYALAALCAMSGILFADIFAETSLPFVYNMGFAGFRASVVSWMMLGGLVVLENQATTLPPG